jgi:hypothetical protein
MYRLPIDFVGRFGAGTLALNSSMRSAAAAI